MATLPTVSPLPKPTRRRSARPRPTPKKPNHATNLGNQTFGGLYVVRRAEPPVDAAGKAMWRVRCARCGKEYDARSSHIRTEPDGCVECKNRKQAPDAARRATRPIWPKACLACGRGFRGASHAKYCDAARCQKMKVVFVALRLSEIDSLMRRTNGRKVTAAGIVRRLLREAGYIGHGV